MIVTGLVVLREVLAAAGLDAIEGDERDLLHGAALGPRYRRPSRATRRQRLHLLLEADV